MGKLSWADVAHMYANSGIQIHTLRGSFPRIGRLLHVNKALYVVFGDDKPMQEQYASYVGFEWSRPVMNHLQDMTKAQAEEFIMIFLESENHEPITIDELHFDLHRWDNAAFLDGDIAIYFTIDCRCCEGALFIYQDGGIGCHDLETGEFYRVTNMTKLIHWLYKNGFDIHGLIESGQAIRKVVDK